MIATPRRCEQELTGAARVRPGWFGRRVLQVQWRLVWYSQCPPPPGRKDDSAWREFCRRGEGVEWRDATWLDLQALPEFVIGARNVHVPAGNWPRSRAAIA